MDDPAVITEIEYGYFIDKQWARIKAIKDDKEFAKALLDLETSHPEILNRSSYDRSNHMIERMFFKQIRHG